MQKLTEGKDFHVNQIPAGDQKVGVIKTNSTIHLKVSKQTFMELKYRLQQEFGLDLGAGAVIDLPHVTLESEAV